MFCDFFYSTRCHVSSSTIVMMTSSRGMDKLAIILRQIASKFVFMIFKNIAAIANRLSFKEQHTVGCASRNNTPLDVLLLQVASGFCTVEGDTILSQENTIERAK